MNDPKIYLGIDNCFASKRWTKPEDWALLIRDLGIFCVECSADTECDPLYMGKDYTIRWIEQTKNACEKTGVRVVNLYSGHGTYSTLGLAHWDPEVRKRFRDQWIKPQADTARALDAGLGFFTHAFDNSVLQSAQQYEEALQELVRNFADLAQYAREIGLKTMGVEQMYSPHQVPWTVDGAVSLLRNIYALGKNPFYLTVDVGHMSGQQYFHVPTEKSLLEAVEEAKAHTQRKRFWVGSDCARTIFDQAAAGEIPVATAVEKILTLAQQTPYLFAAEQDGSPYYWLEQVGCYSPIVHLQQNDGKSSPHWPFDDVHNKNGIIHGEQVLRSLYKSFSQEDDPSLPEKCNEVALTLEPFISTAGDNYTEIRNLEASVAYWRRFIPKDGMYLSEVVAALDEGVLCK